MISNFLKMIFTFLFLTNICMAGGSTIVGDGGYTAICHRHTFFYDHLEYLIANNWKEKEEPKKIIRFFTSEMITIVRNISKDFSLDTKLESSLVIAAKNISAINRFSKNPYEGAPSLAWAGLFLTTNKLDPQEQVKRFLIDNKCELVPVATFIKQREAEDFQIVDACIPATAKHCLVVDRLLFKELNMRDKLCLITHEIFRLIPNSFNNEQELRSLTMKYCSP